jgi:hypothetical protein
VCPGGKGGGREKWEPVVVVCLWSVSIVCVEHFLPDSSFLLVDTFPPSLFSLQVTISPSKKHFIL